MSLLLQTAKAILHEVDGIDGGYDPNSYIPSHLVEALRAAIEIENREAVNKAEDLGSMALNQQVHQMFRSIINTMVK